MDTQQLAMAALGEVWGSTVVLDRPESLGGSNRSHVSRYHVVAGGPGDVETVVVKHAVARAGEQYDPTATDGPAVRLFNDWAGLAFLSECFANADDSPFPRFIAGDGTNGLIVMHDIGAGKGLDHYLLGNDAAAAEECMTALFTTLGRVHAATCGKQARYDEIRDALGPRKPEVLDEHIQWHREHPIKGLAYLGVDVQKEFLDEIEECIKVLRDDGPFRVYTHHDPCPDNLLWIDGRVYLLDFEFSGMANAAVDMRYPRAIWPTCWCANRTPGPIIERLEATYRNELIQGCPAAAEDSLFYRQMAAGCAEAAMAMIGQDWMKWCIEKMAKLGDFRVVQQMIARLEGFALVSEQHNQFPIMGAASRAAATSIRSRMPNDFRELPMYMAFRGEDPQ